MAMMKARPTIQKVDADRKVSLAQMAERNKA